MARRGQGSKTTAERAEYHQNVIRGKEREAPTVDLMPPSDGTDSIAALAVSSNRPITQPRPVSTSWSLKAWLQENALPVIAGTVATVLVGLIAWLANKVVDLNREVGELKTRVETVTKAAEDKSGEEHLERRLDRLEDRLNGRVDRAPTATPTPAPHRP